MWLLPATAKAAIARKRATPYSIPAVCLKWNFKEYCDQQPCQFPTSATIVEDRTRERLQIPSRKGTASLKGTGLINFKFMIK